MNKDASSDTVLDGEPHPPKRGTATPTIRPMSIVAKQLGGRPRPMPHSVRWGLSSPPPKGSQQPPLFGACLLLHCSQTAARIKMPLGTDDDLSPGHIVLELKWRRSWLVGWSLTSPAHGKAHSSPPLFGPCLLWLDGWMDQDSTWYGGRPRPRRHCVRWGSSSGPCTESGTEAPRFSAHLYYGQTVAHLSKSRTLVLAKR